MSPTRLQNRKGYERFLTGRFDVLRATKTDPDSGRPSVTWNVQETDVQGRLVELEPDEVESLSQKHGQVDHKLLLSPDTDIDDSDILRPAGDTDGPAYVLQGHASYQGAVQFAFVQTTTFDDASDYV